MHIPDRIHFYMQHDLPDEAELHNITRWIIAAPEHHICLWLTSFTLAAHIKTLTKVLKDQWEINGRHQIDMQINTPQDVMLTITTRHKGKRQLSLYSLTTLRPLSSTQVVLNEHRIWKNPKGASNIVRLWILSQQGGIFLDQNTKPAARVPHGIVAPMEILFHTLKGTFPPVFTNTVIASTPRAPAVGQLLRLLQQKYDLEYEGGTDLTSAVELTPLGAERVRRLHDLQQELSQRRYWLDRKERKRKKKIQEEIHMLHMQRMEEKTDSRIINYWVEFLERITYELPPLQPHIASRPEGTPQATSFANQEDEHLGSDYSVITDADLPPPTPLEEGGIGMHPHQFMISGTGFINTEAMHYQYSFEKQAGVDIVATTDDDFVLL